MKTSWSIAYNPKATCCEILYDQNKEGRSKKYVHNIQLLTCAIER